MNEQVLFISLFTSGFLLGVLLVFFTMRKKYDLLKAAFQETKFYEEKYHNLEDMLTEVKEEKSNFLEENKKINNELVNEMARRASLEQEVKQIPEMKMSISKLNDELTILRKDKENLLCELKEYKVRLEEELKSFSEKEEVFKTAEKRLSDTFKALSVDALSTNNKNFMELARTEIGKLKIESTNELENKKKSIERVLIPIKEVLDKVDREVRTFNLEKTKEFAELTREVKVISSLNSSLRDETGKLVNALRKPQVRGRWGEIQLKRVVELAGMLEYCDFFEQVSKDFEGSKTRPDMLIRLPNNRNIVVDSKTPLNAYLEAVETSSDDDRQIYLKKHAEQVKKHLIQLSSKSYWEQFQPAPEFVILFLPGETFFSAALEHDPSLIEFGSNQQVIMATPTTLIALLKSVAYGWKQEKVARHAVMISDTGKELHARMRTFISHYSDIRKHLERCVKAYNNSASSLESRVLVSMRKFNELGAATGEEIKDLGIIENVPRSLSESTLEDLS